MRATFVDVMLSNAKHLALSGCDKDEILRLRLRMTFTTQPLKGRKLNFGIRCTHGVDDKWRH
jgi:hypothetical protein